MKYTENLRIRQIKNVDDWMLLNYEMSEEEKCDEYKKRRQTPQNKNEALRPGGRDQEVDQLLDQGPDQTTNQNQYGKSNQ